eukprot:scaffold4781_cov339-Prasinococcus_capsulatus_cf.AAC.6
MGDARRADRRRAPERRGRRRCDEGTRRWLGGECTVSSSAPHTSLLDLPTAQPEPCCPPCSL